MVRAIQCNFTNRYVSKYSAYLIYIISDSESTKFERHVIARGINLLLIPAYAVSGAVDIILGSIGAVGAILHFGTNIQWNRFAIIHLKSSRVILSNMYINLIQFLNPSKSSLFTYVEGGIVYTYANNKIQNWANNVSKSPNRFVQHVVTRLTYALLAVASIISRVADFAIGLVTGSLSIICLCFGGNNSLNRISFRSLQILAIIYDVFYCTIRCINPWSKVDFTFLPVQT